MKKETILGAFFILFLAAPVLGQGSLHSRQVQVNGVILDASTLQGLDFLVQSKVPNGDYWYDATSGLAGKVGKPPLGVLRAGLKLGGPLNPRCSQGGTNIFINGREIHPLERDYLVLLFGYAQPGRYWMDAWGNTGLEGGPPLVNLYAAARQAAQRSNTHLDRGSWSGGTYGSDGSGNFYINFGDGSGYSSW